MRTIAIANQKGGCGKTTTSINLSACLSLHSRKVLLIDLDPQSHASIGLNIKVEKLEKSMYDIFSEANKKNLDDIIVNIDDNFDLAPAQWILSAVEQELAGKMGRESVLLRSIQGMQGNYDYLIVDCPPSLGLLTVNALRACSEAVMPIEMSVFSLQGVARLLEIIEILKVEYGHQIRPKALASICNSRTLFATEVLNNIQQYLGESMYTTVIHDTVKLKEAAGFGLPIHKYSEHCRGTEDYRALASELIAEENKPEVASFTVRLSPKKIDEGIMFRYYGPTAKEVEIAGDFSHWEPIKDLMVQQKENKIWKGTIQLVPGRYQYKFIVDGEWKIDPHNPEVITSDSGISNSVLIVSEN